MIIHLYLLPKIRKWLHLSSANELLSASMIEKLSKLSHCALQRKDLFLIFINFRKNPRNFTQKKRVFPVFICVTNPPEILNSKQDTENLMVFPKEIE